MKKYLLSGLILFTLWSCDNDADTSYENNPIDNFNALWEILDTRYCYFESRNIEWQEVYNLYKPQAAKARTVFELFEIMGNMLDTLDDGHVNLYSPFNISRSRGWYEDYPENFYQSVLYNNRYMGLNYLIAGGFQYARIDSNRVGYVRYSSFSDGFSSANMQYMNFYFKNCKGIIIDVRSNGGGNLSYSERLASCFYKEKTLTGYIRHKTGPGHNDFSKPTPTYVELSDQPVDWSDRKVVVLCNRRSFSATNDFIVKMLEAPNVTVMGGRTGGGGGMPLSSELPNGWLIRFSAVPMYNAKMEEIEFGVEPDITVTTTQADADQGIDHIIDSAIDFIVNQNFQNDNL